MPKLLLVDIETAPNIAYVWGLHQENIPLDRLIQPGRILCWAAKWHKEKEMHFGAEWLHPNRNDFIRPLHAMLSDADGVVTYNGARFDLPKIRGESIALGLAPLPPPTSIDLYSTCRKLGYPSGKLAFVAKHLGLGSKGQHAGFDTWVGAMEGIEYDQRVMERYNKQDVRLLERLYNVLKPHIKEHPYLGNSPEHSGCPTCGSAKLQRRGSRRTRTLVIERLNCQACGSWFSGKATRIKVSD